MRISTVAQIIFNRVLPPINSLINFPVAGPRVMPFLKDQVIRHNG